MDLAVAKLERDRCVEPGCTQPGDIEILVGLHAPDLHEGSIGIGTELMKASAVYCEGHADERYRRASEVLQRPTHAEAQGFAGRAYVYVRRNDPDGQEMARTLGWLPGSDARDRVREIAGVLRAGAR